MHFCPRIMARPISGDNQEKNNSKISQHLIWWGVEKSCPYTFAIHNGPKSKESNSSEVRDLRSYWSRFYFTGWLYFPNQMITLFIIISHFARKYSRKSSYFFPLESESNFYLIIIACNMFVPIDQTIILNDN